MSKKDINSVYKKLRDLRKERKLSREAFCREFNRWKNIYGFEDLPELLDRTYKSWETGEHDPNMDYLPAFCKFYSTDMSYFFDDKRVIKEKVVEDIAEYIGLSEESIIKLHRLVEEDTSYALNMLEMIQSLVITTTGYSLLWDLVNLKVTTIAVESLIANKSWGAHGLYTRDNLYSLEIQCKYELLESQSRFSEYIDAVIGTSDAIKALQKIMPIE